MTLLYGSAESRSVGTRPTETAVGHPPKGRVPVGLTIQWIVRRHPTLANDSPLAGVALGRVRGSIRRGWIVLVRLRPGMDAAGDTQADDQKE